eukprot:c2027_g1_i1 orf=331-2412(-)
MSVHAAYKKLMECGAPSKEDVILQGMCREWIWEFLLKHCSNSGLIRALASAYPLPDSSLHLKRLLLLKSLSFNLSENRVSDRTLETISALSSLYLSENRSPYFHVPVTTSDGTKALYLFSLRDLHLVVRVECTIQYLRADANDWPKFYESLEKYWGDFAEDTQEPEHNDDDVDTGSGDTFLELKEELWAVQKQPELRHDLLKKRKREYVTRMMQSFLSDAWKDVGLVFLEGVAQNLKKGVYVPDGFPPTDAPSTKEAEKSSPGSERPSRCIVGSTSKDLEKGPHLPGRPSPRSLVNAPNIKDREIASGHTEITWVEPKHMLTESLGRTEKTQVEQMRTERESLLPRKRRIPVSLQEKRTELKLLTSNKDVLQAVETGQPRITRISLLADKSLSGEWGTVVMGQIPPISVVSEVPSLKEACLPEVRKTCPTVVMDQRDEGVNDEEPVCPSPPPWAGSPGLNDTITVRKRPKLAACCSEGIHLSETVAAVGGKGRVETPVILRAQSELREGQASLRAAVRDPLPEALKIAEEAAKISEVVRRVSGRTIPVNDRNEGMQSLSVEGAVQEPQEKPSKKNIMDRNPTAHTIEWETSDDIADSSDDESPSRSRKVHLPSLRTRQSIALQGGIAARNRPCRRKIRRWTQEEENALRKEVERYGKGHWKHILQKHKDIFESRTEVDLKDKWRNIERREGIL